MANNKKGFALIEVFVTLSLLAVLGSIVVFTPNNLYCDMLLKSTAVEIKEALQLAQQLSLDESREYRVNLTKNGFTVKEDMSNGKTVMARQFDKGILRSGESHKKITYNRNGETAYGKFILINKRGKKIIIEILIGTGRVRISDVY